MTPLLIWRYFSQNQEKGKEKKLLKKAEKEIEKETQYRREEDRGPQGKVKGEVLPPDDDVTRHFAHERDENSRQHQKQPHADQDFSEFGQIKAPVTL